MREGIKKKGGLRRGQGGKGQAQSCLTLWNPWTVARQAPMCVEVSRQEYWRGCHSLLQGIFLTQGSNLRVLHRQVDSLPLVPLRTPTIFPTHVFFLNRLSYDSEPLFGPCLRKSRFQCLLACFLAFIVLFVLLLSAARSHWHWVNVPRSRRASCWYREVKGTVSPIIQLISPVLGFLVPSELVLGYFCALWGISVKGESLSSWSLTSLKDLCPVPLRSCFLTSSHHAQPSC